MSGAVQFVLVDWPAAAERLGFTSDAGGEWVRDGCALRSCGSWLSLALREPGGEDSPLGRLGAPGLWRRFPERRPGTAPRLAVEFDLPPLASPEACDGEDADHPCAALVRWAEATLGGSAPAGWEPPLRADVEEWVEPARRSVRAGAQVAQIDLVVEPVRFALVIPELVRIPGGLPPARAAWISEVCCDIQKRWRMVRAGIDEAAGGVRAEVDLTGAPPDRARPLAELAAEALGCSAAWALPAISLVTDPACSSEALDEEPRWASSRLSKGGRTR